jgi:hypothetical protein
VGRKYYIYLKEKDVRMGLGSADSRWGPVAVSCESSNKPLSYVKGGKFIDWLTECELLKERTFDRCN